MKPYAEMVIQAEEVTKAIKDPELRRVAFERVLDDLLSGDESVSKKKAATKQSAPVKGIGTKQKNSGPKGYVRELIDEDFFNKPKTIAEVKAELANRGHHIALTSLSGPLQSLCQDRLLRRHKAKSGSEGKKVTFNYAKW
jgi:hypothetical protein